MNHQQTTTASAHGVHSEVGTLRTVLLHRPGRELERLTPRNSAQLLFDGLPWLEKAQEEHDNFADMLRGRGTEVLYVTELLRETLNVPAAREAAIAAALARPQLGPVMLQRLRGYLEGLDADDLTHTLTAGLRCDEMRAAAPTSAPGLVAALAGDYEFVLEPLPNLLFTRDSSTWVKDHVAVTSLAMPARLRETSLTKLIYTHHPRFAGTPQMYSPDLEFIEGGDVLKMGDGVLAIGIGERTTPAGAERFAQKAFEAGVATTVMAVPIPNERAMMHLDTVCTMVDRDAVVIYPVIAEQMQAFTMTADGDGVHVDKPHPFLEAAATALQLDKVRVIDAGLDPVEAEREQWDDGNNTLAVAPGVVVTYERNVRTNKALEEAGIEVLRLAGTELGSGRGGPRCMSCPITRDPA